MHLQTTQATFQPINFPAKRFGIETFIIVVSLTINVLGLYLVAATHKKSQSVYHILYFNLALSNLIACPLTWLCNNMMFLFNDWFNDVMPTDLRCEAVVYSTVGVFVALSVGIQMTLAMLGLTMAQYVAICHPLKSIYMLEKRRAYIFIPIAIVISLTCAGTPFAVLLHRVKTTTCTDALIGSIFGDVILGANVLTSIIIVLYVLMASVGVRVYVEMRQHLKRKLELGGNVNAKKMKDDHRAFGTTMLLLLTLTLFFIPFTIYFVTKLNVDGLEGVAANVSIFYLTMMPCAKCIFDPIIYGARMRDVKAQYKRLTGRCLGFEQSEKSSSGQSKPSSSGASRSKTAVTGVSYKSTSQGDSQV